MAGRPSGPFSLATILEEEYAALHGPLPAETTLGEKDRLAALYTHIHRLPRKRTALCLSGGGIRSATFGLGVLQGLARLSLLKQFDYLSTVSGGGYIGSWLTAWIHRPPDGVAGVTQKLSTNDMSRLGPAPKELEIFCDIAEALHIANAQDEDVDGVLLETIAVFDDLIRAIQINVPAQYMSVLSALSERLAAGPEFASMLTETGLDRETIEDAIMWGVGAVAVKSRWI